MDMHVTLWQLQIILQSAKGLGKTFEGISILHTLCILSYSRIGDSAGDYTSSSRFTLIVLSFLLLLRPPYTFAFPFWPTNTLLHPAFIYSALNLIQIPCFELFSHTNASYQTKNLFIKLYIYTNRALVDPITLCGHCYRALVLHSILSLTPHPLVLSKVDPWMAFVLCHTSTNVSTYFKSFNNINTSL